MKTIREILELGPVVPVIIIDRLADAVPLARALVAGDIRVLEVTLRTPVALEAVRAIRNEVPEAIVGVGTITRGPDFGLAREAGAQFTVSPGATTALLSAARNAELPYLPGVMTPSDVVGALGAGFDTMKLFPAREAGGVEMLKAFAGPFPTVKFCPTGGIDAASAPDYLRLPNVACVGGSWITAASLVARRDWAEIQRRARTAASLRVAA